jgi:hypothetical protein
MSSPKQLAPLSDSVVFEKLVRDIMRREYDDPSIELFGRSGQGQHGIDGLSVTKSGITFQCKLKNIKDKTDEQWRKILLAEMDEELEKTSGLQKKIKRFIFTTTYKNDTILQEKAELLTTELNDNPIVEYWGWDTISEKLWEYGPELLPIYYPEIAIKKVRGLRRITKKCIDNALIIDNEEYKNIALDYYRVNDNDEVVFRVPSASLREISRRA